MNPKIKNAVKYYQQNSINESKSNHQSRQLVGKILKIVEQNNISITTIPKNIELHLQTDLNKIIPERVLTIIRKVNSFINNL